MRKHIPFKPYQIQHVQLVNIQHTIFFNDQTYLVIWFKHIPLGNVWFNDGLSLPNENKYSQINKAIEKAIFHYSNFLELSSQEQIISLLKKNEYQLVFEILNEIDLNQVFPYKRESVSVIICTRNRTNYLENTLKSLANSSEKDFELIVVDNAPSSDATELLINKFPNVRYVKEEKKGLDYARNTGVLQASNDIIAYTDDDVIVPEDWIKNIRTCFENPLTMAVAGLVIPSQLETEAQYIFEKDYGFNKGYLPLNFDHQYFLNHMKEGVPVWDIGAGANMAFRKEAFKLFGYFDERLDVGAAGCSGDSEYWYKILAEGWNCTYFPHLIVYHYHRREMDKLKNQLFNYMRGHVSSVLVQYQKYGHFGNIHYLKNRLFPYYVNRLKSTISDRGKGVKSLLNEINGSLSGWVYFVQNRHRNETSFEKIYPKNLNKDVYISVDMKISVIIPCYNHGRYLQQSIESALNQMGVNTEVIVVNDGSTDNTEDICNQYPSVIKIDTHRVGLSAARNIGVYMSTGDFVTFLDADDYLHPNGLLANINHFKVNPDAAFVFGIYDKVNDTGEILSSAEVVKLYHVYEVLLYGNHIAMEATVMYRRSLFFSFKFDPKLKACEDYDINLRISRRYPVYGHSNKIANYRIHESNMSQNNQLMLNSVLKVLNNQKPFLKNKDEYIAWKKGKKYWKNYYGKH